nr:uncharacterized protein LOC117688618 [Crassostrea gigas]
MTRDITTKTHRQHVINEEPLHDDLSSATAEMDGMVSNQETVKKLKADLNSFIKTAPEGQNEFMQFQADKNCTDSESEFFQSQTTSTEGTEMSSQGSLKVDIFDRLNTFLKDIDLEPFSFPHLLWKTYTAKTKHKYFKGMQNMLERVAEILFDNEKETVVKEFYREVGNSDPVDVSLDVCDDTTDALIESYKKAYSWQIKRQILSVLCVSRTYQEMKILLPDVTEYSPQ